MAVLSIHKVPDPILRQRAKRVGIIDKSLQRLINDMIETMHSAPGVGLAAPQVGIPLRILVIGIPDEKDIILVNPEIVRRSGERIIDEGCLSLPGYIGQVKRSEVVTVKGLNAEGKEVRLKGRDLLAQAIEHEIDHLNGVLYIDKLEGMDKPRKVIPQEMEVEPTKGRDTKDLAEI